ncbi:MAG TPA: response regulator transcription factor [Gaiellaceae bacterium]|jgi:DNA-binding NarL/FixJ family response regulator|nr:response regulator transcription factor [Gaiellaceae bacterium]
MNHRAPHERPTCLLVDDHEEIRSSLASLLESEGFVIVAAAGTGAEAVSELETHRPGLAVIDYGLPDFNGLEVAREAARLSPETLLVLFTGEASAKIVRDALAAGVRGVVVKDVPPMHLMQAIDAVLAGETYVDPVLKG